MDEISQSFSCNSLIKNTVIAGLLFANLPSYGANKIYDVETLFVTSNQSLNKCSVGIDGTIKCDYSPLAININANSTINTSAYGNNRIFLGEKNGVLSQCIPGGNCTSLYNFNLPITKILQNPIPTIQNSKLNPSPQTNVLYVGLLKSNDMWKCDPNSTGNICGDRYFNTFDSNVNDIIYGNNKLYVGLANGKMWQCDPTANDGCGDRYFNVLPTKINSLAYGELKQSNGSPVTVTVNGVKTQIPVQLIYTGLDNGELRVCDANNKDGCGTTGDYKFDSPITSLSFVSRVNQSNRTTVQNLYVGLNNGKVYECTPNSENGSLKNQCNLISPVAQKSNVGVTSLQYLAYKTNNNEIAYKLYAGRTDGKILDCTLTETVTEVNNSPPNVTRTSTCNPTLVTVNSGQSISSMTSGAGFLPDLLPGRGCGDIPLNQIYTTEKNFNPFIVNADQNLVYRNNSGCEDVSCTTINKLRSIYSSINQLHNPTTGCDGFYPSETLYAINAAGELKLVEACSNADTKSTTRRHLQMLKYDYTHSGISAFMSIKRRDPGNWAACANPETLKAVHPLIDGDIPSISGQINYGYIKSQIYGAGTMTVADGKILQFDNCSGHFQPPLANLYYTWQYLISKGFISAEVPFKPMQSDTSPVCQKIQVR